jgi:hypothetical protein
MTAGDFLLDGGHDISVYIMLSFVKKNLFIAQPLGQQ